MKYFFGEVFMGDCRCVESDCKSSLRKLKIEYADLMLLHWPIAFEKQ